MDKLILNTDLCKIIQTKNEIKMLITCADGTVLEHQPFKNDLEGLVSAISLSAEICAGKFFVRSVYSSKPTRLKIGAKREEQS